MIDGVEVNLGFACDLMHGKCWMCRAWNWDACVCAHGFGKNKFTAVREAIKNLKGGL